MRKILFIVVFLLYVTSVNAKIKLPSIVSSNMVLQRNTEISIWGWAKPGEKIKIKANWLKHDIKIRANKQGKWITEIKTSDAGGPYEMVVQGENEKIILNNILLGDVWLCSGQSNMRMRLGGNVGQPVFDGNKAIVHSANHQLRLFSVKEKASETTLDTLMVPSTWMESSPNTAVDFSAVAYFFGSQLQNILDDVPVGLIMTSWGASKVEAWISEESLNLIDDVNWENEQSNGRIQQKPKLLFNAMIHPLINFKLKGVLWYQGESNRDNSELYGRLFPLMVKDWRKWWNHDFPFYYVQIAPFAYSGEWNSAEIRQKQLESLKLIPNSGMAVTMDIGDKHCIHPPVKKEVANRLLYLALNRTYGFKDIDDCGPIYDNMNVKEGKVVLTFKYAENGLYCQNRMVDGFEIAGDDGVFYSAKAIIIKRKNIELWSAEVPHPRKVRYGWCNYISGSLFDGSMLPASSFTTVLNSTK